MQIRRQTKASDQNQRQPRKKYVDNTTHRSTTLTSYIYNSKETSDSASEDIMIGVSAVVCIPQGLNVSVSADLEICFWREVQTDGELAISTAPTKGTRSKYESAGLSILADDEQPLKFGKNWTNAQCENWLQRVLPKLFEHIALNPVKAYRQWSLVTKDRNTLSVVAKKTPKGQDFFQHKGRPKAGVNDSIIFIGILPSL